ncbi:hypothetical protein [Glycomyces algeriensis]|uniref:Uncharacterized protein n=1 Tax=Glycomyces algeriensis TaxID=256037 RepID=A0A9W6G5W4_9ACTN|nr:hypothetical protein [Glycomyces algeriensis]MDA1367492.1 hypothetical protein [Glycomyces algeriensis]MDR7353145.1 hypothetical protein [Glycomyces algeriensis]GLI40838.1 hypothetical protein GALLR39Z86_06880 [Glycomyces algeriensis]
MSDTQQQNQNQNQSEDPDLGEDPNYDDELDPDRALEPDPDEDVGEEPADTPVDPDADDESADDPDEGSDDEDSEDDDADSDDGADEDEQDDDPDDVPDDDSDEEDDDEDDEEESDEDDGKKEEENEDKDHQGRQSSYEREDWDGQAPDNSADFEYQRMDAQALFLSGAPCPHATCENTENPAEAAWIKLVSAIPEVGQVSNLTVVTTGTAAPGQDAIQSLVSQVRPDNPDTYALRAISTHWQTFKDGFDTDPTTGIAPMLKSGLRTLSEHWQGDDFDAFAEQVEVVMSNCASVCDDIGDLSSGAVGLLEQKADEFYGLQGGSSGELPYPAPLYWISDLAVMYTDPFVHVRPPFRSGLCDVTNGCGHAGGLVGSLLELGGFDKDYLREVSNYVESQTEYYMNKFKNDKPPPTPEQCAAWAQADANNEMSSDMSAGLDDYESRSRIANEDVMNRWENAEESAGTFAPEAKPSNPSNFREASDMLEDSYGGLDAGSGGFVPGSEPPSPDAGGAGGGGGGGGLEPPGGVSGGLASGGSTLGSGGSFPVGPASSTLESGSSAANAAGGGRGGGGMGGMMGGGGAGGGRGMGGDQEAEGEHRDWLEEDEEIWGIRKIDEDPYA